MTIRHGLYWYAIAGAWVVSGVYGVQINGAGVGLKAPVHPAICFGLAVAAFGLATAYLARDAVRAVSNALNECDLCGKSMGQEPGDTHALCAWQQENSPERF